MWLLLCIFHLTGCRCLYVHYVVHVSSIWRCLTLQLSGVRCWQRGHLLSSFPAHLALAPPTLPATWQNSSKPQQRFGTHSVQIAEQRHPPVCYRVLFDAPKALRVSICFQYSLDYICYLIYSSMIGHAWCVFLRAVGRKGFIGAGPSYFHRGLPCPPHHSRWKCPFRRLLSRAGPSCWTTYMPSATDTHRQLPDSTTLELGTSDV